LARFLLPEVDNFFYPFLVASGDRKNWTMIAFLMQISAADERGTALLRTFRSMLGPTRVTPGCLDVRLYSDLDVKSLCAGVQPGDGRIKACIKSHFSDVSAPCQAMLVKGAASSKACSADVKKVCADVKPGGSRIEACMKSHLSEVSDPCKDAVRPQLAKADKFEERSLNHIIAICRNLFSG
jgi:hypothetical protein